VPAGPGTVPGPAFIRCLATLASFPPSNPSEGRNAREERTAPTGSNIACPLCLSNLDLRPKWSDRPGRPGQTDLPAEARGPGPVPRSSSRPESASQLTQRQTAARTPPSATPADARKDPQSFDLYRSGQKVGGDITRAPRQVKGRSRFLLALAQG